MIPSICKAMGSVQQAAAIAAIRTGADTRVGGWANKLHSSMPQWFSNVVPEATWGVHKDLNMQSTPKQILGPFFFVLGYNVTSDGLSTNRRSHDIEIEPIGKQA